MRARAADAGGGQGIGRLTRRPSEGWGPGGGSARKPVGSVVFARARRGDDPKRIDADHKDFGDLGRGGVRLQAALCALELLLPPEQSP